MRGSAESGPAAARPRGTPGAPAGDPGDGNPIGTTVEPAASDDPPAPIPLVSSPDGAGPPPELATAILGAYTAFWDSYWEAASHPVDPEHPGIARFSTEPLRSRAAGVLLGRVTEGIALRLPPDHGAGRIVHIEGWDDDGAELLDCFVDEAVLYEVSTGRIRNDEQATVVHLALMRRIGDSWRVAEIFEQATHTGRTDGCIMQLNTRATPGPTGTAPAPPPGAGGDGAHGQESPW